MVLVLRALLVIGGLFFVLLGASFMIDPQQQGADFGLIADGVQGLSSIRADLTAFFWVGGGCMIWGGWARKGDSLLASAGLFGVGLLGRTVNLVQHGTYDGWLEPVLVEAVVTTLCLVASRVLPHHALAGNEKIEPA